MRSDAFSIVVSKEDSNRVLKMLMRCQAVTVVNDKETLDQARTAAGQLKALINEIQDAKKAAKRPFGAVEQTIENKAQEISEGLLIENQRILGLMNAYISQLEAQARAEQRRREEAARAERAKYEADLERARKAQREAEEAARKAEDEAERLRLKQEAERLANARLEAELDQALADDLAGLGKKPQPALITGGRVDHPWKFKLVDVRKVVESGFQRCLRFEPDYLACKDVVKAQLERWGPDAQPKIPGFEITRETSVSVRASA